MLRRSLARLPLRRLLHHASTTPKKTVVVGMSGGVDSSVTAYLLHQDKSLHVVGLYMNNWDSSDEEGKATCPADMDYELVRQVCEEIGIECTRVDFVQEYWNNVFEPCLDQFAKGLTPNPDVLCNKEIKFDVFAKHAMALGPRRRLHCDGALRAAQAIAQWHQCALRRNKDQSYFLSHVTGAQFQRVIFPLGGLCKPRVREIAAEANLCTAAKKDSVGICFIGKRSFGSFLSQYVPPRPGSFVSVVDEQIMHAHDGYSAYTIGQGAKVSGLPTKWFVVGKRDEDAAVFIAPGTHHPALFSDEVFVRASAFNWIQGHMPVALAENGRLRCQYRARYRQPLAYCTISMASVDDVTSGLSVYQPMAAAPTDEPYLRVQFDVPQRGVSPAQSLVLYEDDGLCYGGGPILGAGPSYWEQQKPLPSPLFDWSM
ncbi:tRNA methyl transferase [Saprolegnia parasitica CBS 223.65]|uniref:tRNA-5-taurinomethyluridine 2-sulfurtransferase n=1 Tax=Saprolegnia parasitica (strain CBS 223.65) TaxID=695850 RepID=A0A067CIJ9_SAPPC|nr:tRNA methyl transferase [Saprolegnia parasitica CBS 223.65]KDO26366.1 tRNA methyl transferase [Saprolegnia parasitica CBS 223.65]|eukprot:XP_012202804.1 tRNA methyl transferase [Saprolegnia parasitica CBS 223.65]